jgi:hypothetical protein
MCYDVCYQDALTVLVIASDWSQLRGVFVWWVIVYGEVAEKSKGKAPRSASVSYAQRNKESLLKSEN